MNLAKSNMSAEEARLDITHAIAKYVDNIELELRDRWNNMQIDLTKKYVNEVVCGILSRQVAILTNYATSSNFWNGDMAPIILRSLADNYINLAWILKDPETRSKRFVLHGLGQEKLQLEHRKNELRKQGIDLSNDPIVDSNEKWINAQRYTFWTEVNVGSWSEMSTRQMAEEADCIDFYNFVYQPFSAATHSMWNHISRYNLDYSENPLHMFLLKPVVHRFDPEFEYLELGVKYLEKMFDLFDRTFEYTPSVRRSSAILALELNRIEEALKKTLLSERGESNTQGN